MNILVVCHDYKNHDVLTLITGSSDNDYIYLTPENIRNISSLTNGLVSNISYIDTNEDTIVDKFQYNNWINVPENTFDLFYTIFCPNSQQPIIISEYASKLKSNGKIIDMKDELINGRSYVDYDDNFFPLIASPFSPTHFKMFGPYVYFVDVYDNATKTQKKEYISFNTELLPQIDDYGNIIMPSKKPKPKRSIKKSANNVTGKRNFRKSKKTRKSKK